MGRNHIFPIYLWSNNENLSIGQITALYGVPLIFVVKNLLYLCNKITIQKIKGESYSMKELKNKEVTDM